MTMSLVNVVTTPCGPWAPGQIAQSMRGAVVARYRRTAYGR